MGNYNLGIEYKSVFDSNKSDASDFLVPSHIQKEIGHAIASKAPDADGRIRIIPGVDVSQSTLNDFAQLLEGYATNAPDPLFNGFSLSTDDISKGFELFGIKSGLPSGIGVFFDPDTSHFGVFAKKSL